MGRCDVRPPPSTHGPHVPRGPACAHHLSRVRQVGSCFRLLLCCLPQSCPFFQVQEAGRASGEELFSGEDAVSAAGGDVRHETLAQGKPARPAGPGVGWLLGGFPSCLLAAAQLRACFRAGLSLSHAA